jgi:hypothetical protein
MCLPLPTRYAATPCADVSSLYHASSFHAHPSLSNSGCFLFLSHPALVFTSGWSYELQARYVEIYNESINDLLYSGASPAVHAHTPLPICLRPIVCNCILSV